jgi:hypothetical protein
MAEFHTSFKFDTVLILDSLLLEEDPQTGLWLRDTVLQPLAASQGFKVGYFRVENAAQLYSALAEIERLVIEAGLGPILHFESHGVPEGIALADRSIVPWQSFKAPLTAINRACRMNLLAVMSMCHGAHLISQLQPVEPSPVWALIGAAHEVFPCRLQEAFEAFYTELLSALNARAAIEAMNARHADGKSDLTIDIAEIWFCRIWRRYEQEKCTPDERKAREDELVVKMMRQSGYNLRYAAQSRVLAKEGLADNESLFKKFRRSFLMIDSFPENKARFPLTYRDCVEVG